MLLACTDIGAGVPPVIQASASGTRIQPFACLVQVAVRHAAVLGPCQTFHVTAAAWQHSQPLPSCPTRVAACRSERTYSHVMRLLNEYNVDLSGILLKPNMCLPGGQLLLYAPVTTTSGMPLRVVLAGN